MIEVDLYSKKTKWYYWGLTITIITFSFIGIARAINLHGHSRFMPLFTALLIIGVFVSVAFIFTAVLGVGIYVKDGELVLNDGYLIIDTINIPLDKIKDIKLKMATRTIKSFILIRNRIEIVDNNGGVYIRKFAIRSSEQDEQFSKIIYNWRSLGVIITGETATMNLF